MWGRSCHGREDVARAAAEGFDYATLSPYAATTSKPGYGPPLAPGALRGHPIPVYALGGVTTDKAAQAVADGAYGVAVMGEVMRAAEPAQVVHDLLAVLPPLGGAPDEEGPSGRKENSFRGHWAAAEEKFLPPSRGAGLAPEFRALDEAAPDEPAPTMSMPPPGGDR